VPGYASPSRPFVATIERIEHVRLTGPWPELRELFHDEARLESIASSGVYGPDETVEAMRVAALDGVYAMGPWRIETLEANVVLLHSTMRHLAKLPNGKSGMTDASYVWLMVGRDGLLWRMKIFHTRDAAIEHLKRYGSSLGIEGAEHPSSGPGDARG
jgi:hypothetical protein